MAAALVARRGESVEVGENNNNYITYKGGCACELNGFLFIYLLTHLLNNLMMPFGKCTIELNVSK